MQSEPISSILLVNARLVDPASGTEGFGGVLIRDGVIAPALGSDVTAANAPDDVRVVDCKGDIVAPGLIDTCVFVGEPGAEYRETIASATAAAAAGGVTSIVTLPESLRRWMIRRWWILLRRARDTG